MWNRMNLDEMKRLNRVQENVAECSRVESNAIAEDSKSLIVTSVLHSCMAGNVLKSSKMFLYAFSNGQCLFAIHNIGLYTTLSIMPFGSNAV